ncbi:hypothetical protein BV22DRAFT_1026465, partial [Leucogyrophana mollusca]
DDDELDFTDTQRNEVRILDGHIYSTTTCQINYTTYDVQQEQDTINPYMCNNIFVASRESEPDSHPYWYARVLGIFHARVLHTGKDFENRPPQTMEFLWIRWFGVVPGHLSGQGVARLPKVGFVPNSDPLAFGFLHPLLVIRACYLIPSFTDGRTTNLLRPGLSAGRKPGEADDWEAYYVNM